MVSDAGRAAYVRLTQATPTADGHPDTVYHYSEDATITRFVPQVPRSNPGHPPAVWAIDAEHAPLYWFPRRCPRVSVWAYDEVQRAQLAHVFQTEASRVCAVETSWVEAVRAARIYEYRFDGSRFAPWAEASGQYITGDVVTPDEVEAIDDVLALHAGADVELRFTPKLGALMDAMLASSLPFSFVRIRDARR